MNPWLYVAAGVAALGLIACNVALYYRGEAAIADKHTAEEKMAVAEKAAADSKVALAVLQAQHEGGQQVAQQVLTALAEQQAFAKGQQQRISNASLTQANNNVVPGVVADTYDELQRRRSSGAAARAGGSAAAGRGPDNDLPVGAAYAAPQPAPGQRRAPARRRVGAAGRRR